MEEKQQHIHECSHTAYARKSRNDKDGNNEDRRASQMAGHKEKQQHRNGMGKQHEDRCGKEAGAAQPVGQ